MKHVRPSREIKNNLHELPKTDRAATSKYSTEEYEKEDFHKITVNSFARDFVVGKGGFGKVWKVSEKATKKIYAMKEMQKVKIISKRSVHSVMN